MNEPRTILAPVGEFSEEIYAKLQAYVDLLLKWNQKINLVSRSSANEEEIWSRHVLDSAQLIKYIPQYVVSSQKSHLYETSSRSDRPQKLECIKRYMSFEDGHDDEIGHRNGFNIIDFGSGAGFPGLILSILGVTGINLIESNQKKCAFLSEAVRITGCDAKVICSRIEEVRPFPCDLVVTRAFASVNEILNYLSPFLKNETRCLLLKGKNVQSEIDEIKSFWHVTEKLYESIVTSQGSDSGFILELKNIKRR